MRYASEIECACVGISCFLKTKPKNIPVLSNFFKFSTPFLFKKLKIVKICGYSTDSASLKE